MLTYVVRATDWKVVEQTREVSLLVEGLGLLGINSSDLVQIKDLNIMANSLRTNNGIVVEHTNLTPGRTERVLSRQTSEVSQLAFLVNLDKSSAGVLSDQTDLTTFGTDPAPDGRTASVRVTGSASPPPMLSWFRKS